MVCRITGDKFLKEHTMTKTIRNTLMTVSAAAASFAFADAVTLTKAPTIQAGHVIGCPAGTAQVGGINSHMSAIACMKMSADGSRVFHGPMVSLYGNGKVEAVGQTVEGMRSGRWTFFDATGTKVGETEFANGDYHGRRLVYSSTGALKADEFWVNGKRQGAQKTIDESGRLAVVQFVDDRPVK
jgi:hypothetical protein